MKHIIIIVFSLLMLVGCAEQQGNSHVVNEKNQTDVEKETVIMEATSEQIANFTPDEAVQLCQNKIGVKDDENFIFKFAEVHTGRNIGYRYDETIEYNNKKYHIVSMLWTEENSAIWSNINLLAVSADEIYSVYCRSNLEYSFEELLWMQSEQGA